MKILYGVVGEGMGHAIRSTVVIQHLLAQGHEVHIAVSGRAYDYLKARFEGVQRIWGLTMVMDDNAIQKRKTALEVLKGAVTGVPENLFKNLVAILEDFKPECVVTDFETGTALFGVSQNLPIISVDNMQIIRRCWHPPEILRGRTADWRLAKSVIKAKIPHADHYIITTFFDAPIKRRNTTLVSPILRDSILQATPRDDGEHILVYQTSESFKELPELLKGFDAPFRIYGLRRNLTEPVVEGNLTFCPFSEEGFIADLASCRGVIASAGFTLIGEALHLGRPYLATPVRGQFEQVMNARYIEHLGYGLQDEDLDEFSIGAFIQGLDTFRQNLQAYPRADNSALFAALDEQLDRAAAGL